MGIDAEMFVRTRDNVTPSVLRAAEHALYARFGKDVDTYADQLLEVVQAWEQDGPTLQPQPGETFVRVAIYTRYYGLDYERGDFRLIHDLAEMLEHLFPSGEVWYGGDSSGVCAELFDAAARAELRAHWIAQAHKPYRDAMSFSRRPGPLCRKCDVAMPQYGSGPAYAMYACDCGEKRVEQNGVITTTSRRAREKRYHELRHEACKALETISPAAAKELRELGFDMY